MDDRYDDDDEIDIRTHRNTWVYNHDIRRKGVEYQLLEFTGFEEQRY
jgi:hypothetical protein